MTHPLRVRALSLGTLLFLGCGSSGEGGGNPPIESDGSVLDADAFVPPDTATDAPSIEAGVNPCVGGVALPGDTTYVAGDLCARAVGNFPHLRQITFSPDGALYGATSDGKLVRMKDDDGDGAFSGAETSVWATLDGNTNNVHIDVAGGFLYAGNTNGVVRFPFVAGAKTAGAKTDVVTDAPAGGSHPLHTVHVWDGYLYVHSGSASNATDPMSPAYDTDRSLLMRFSLAKAPPYAWADGERVSFGLRNMVGYARAASGKIYGVVNGLDDVTYEGVDVHADNPGELLVLLESGKRYGYPFCFVAQRVVKSDGTLVPPGTQLRYEGFGADHDDAWCAANADRPTSFFQAHSAPLDLTFFDGATVRGGLPDRYRGGAFVSFHGSWDRGVGTGYKVVWIPFDASGNAPMPTSTKDATTFPYVTIFGGGSSAGPADGPWLWSASKIGESPRPVGVAISPIDGALYVASDAGGEVYRLGAK